MIAWERKGQRSAILDISMYKDNTDKHHTVVTASKDITKGFVEQKCIHTLLDAAVPKLSSSEAVSVVIFPVTPEIWNNRSPSSCTELNLQTNNDMDAQLVNIRVTFIQSLMCYRVFQSDLILHRSSNRPCSSSGSSSAMAVSAYMLMIR